MCFISLASGLLHDSECVHFSDRCGIGRSNGAWWQKAVFSGSELVRKHHIKRSISDSLAVEFDDVSCGTSRRVQHTTRNRAKLSVILVLMKSDELILGDRYTFRSFDQELQRSSDPVPALGSFDIPVNVSLNKSTSTERLQHPAGFPVHYFRHYFDPFIFLF